MKKATIIPGFMTFVISLLWYSCSFAQQPGNGQIKPENRNWLEMMQDPQEKFSEVQRAFYRYWEQRMEIKKKETGEEEEGEEFEESEGEGYQIFKRWEYRNQTRVLPDGRLHSPGYVKEVFDKYMAESDAPGSSAGNWSIVGPTAYVTNNTGQPTGMGRINAIAFHPTDPNTLYIGAPSGGVWKTTNLNGNSTVWTNLCNNLPTLGVSSILIHPADPNIIYLGTGDRDAGDAPGIGVYKTTDGGTTWSQISLGMGNVTVGAMVMLPSDPNTIIAATSGGIFKTTNGGASWIYKQAGSFKDIRFKPGDPTIVYAVNVVTPGEFYRSVNTGDSWTKNTSIPSLGVGSRMVIGVTPANPAYVYLVQTKSDNTFSNLLRSTNSGLTFTAMASNPPNIMSSNCGGTGTSTQATYDLCIAVDQSDANVVYVGGVNVWKTIDGGANWAIKAIWAGDCSGTAVAVHADHHVFEWSPLNGMLYDGHDGGIHYTANGANSFTEITGGLPITQIYKIGQGASNVDYCLFGCQDNGSAATLNGSSFYTTRGGDGMETLIDYTNSNYCYNTYTNGAINRSSTGPTGSYNYSLAGNGINGIDESGAWVAPYFLHKADHLTMFAGYKNVWRTNNVTSTPPIWVKISSGETATVSVLEQSPASVDIIYAVRSGSLKRTDNANAASGSVTWTACALPGGYTPTDIKAHPTDANIVYATAGYNVFKSTDKGATWTNITGNLPAIFTNCLAIDKNGNEALYVGNETGVWFKDATMSNWMLFSNGMPPADVRELEIYYDAVPANNRIKAGTYGRGLWQSDLAQVNVINPANFTATADGSAQINLSWTKNAANDNVMIAWSAISTFGQPVDGTTYNVGNSIPGGGTVFYSGSLSAYNHSSLTAGTTYYYKIWSVNGSVQYSSGVGPISEITDCGAITSFPYSDGFDNPACWRIKDNTGRGGWQFGATTNAANPPTILVPSYAYMRSMAGNVVNFNADLISPTFDLSAFSSTTLRFNQHFDTDATWTSTGTVSYSLNNGSTWTTLVTYTTDQSNTTTNLLIPGTTGKTQVKFRWNYTDTDMGSYMWGIDDIVVSECHGVWSGTTSTDWFTASNWCDNTVPTATSDVVIPSGAANMPYINTTTVATCKNITISTGATLKMGANTELDVKGNWICDGSFDYSGSSSSSLVKFNGSTSQTISGNSATNLKRVAIDNGSGVTLANDLRGDNIWLTNGVVTTGNYKLNLFGGSLTRTNGWVNGILQKWVWSNASAISVITFEIGNSTNYLPVVFTFPAGSITTGNALAIRTLSTDHPNIVTSTLNYAKSVNRYWNFPTVSLVFSSASAVFNFAAGDLDAGTNTANLIAGRYGSSTWTYPAVGTKTSTSTQITGFTSATLGDIQLAETCTAPDVPTLSATINPICAGSSSMLSIASGNLNSALNWQWYTVSCGGSLAGSGTGLTVSPTTTTTYYARGEGGCIAPGSCASLILTVNTCGKLSVAAGGNWSDPDTWTPSGVPGNSDDATILSPGTVTVDINSALCNNLSIQTGASLEIAQAQAITVNGTLTNNAGTAGLVIKSGTTGTGSLILNTSGVNGTMQRYVSHWTDDNHGWHFLSSPVVSQTIQPEFVPGTNPIGTTQDFYAWDEANGYWFNSKSLTGSWVPEFETNFIPGKGYLVAYQSDVTKSFTGEFNVSNVNRSGLTYTPGPYSGFVTPGWNLLGNPFTSALNWYSGWTVTNISPIAKIWKESDASYIDVNPGEIIPAAQGFMVNVLSESGGSVSIPASARIHSPLSWYKESSSPGVRLVIRDLAGATAQENRVLFKADAALTFDPDHDSPFLPGYAPVFCSRKGSSSLSTATIPVNKGKYDLFFEFVKNPGTDYELESGISGTMDGSLFLTDLKTNETWNLTDRPDYLFTAAAGDSPTRFLLSFHPVGIPEKGDGSQQIHCFKDNIVITGQGQSRFEIISVSGKILISRELNVNGTCQIKVDLPTGYYFARLTTKKAVNVTRVFIQSN